MKKHNILKYFSWVEWLLWGGSWLVILSCFFIFAGKNYIALTASLLGTVALIFCAKGNPIGQVMMIVFSLLYAVDSFACRYYGEMITYLGMTAPMSVFALISWLKNPYKGNKSEVKVNRLTGKEWIFATLLTMGVTVAFYFILGALNTANLIWSSLSVTTSFFAVYLTFRRSPYYALAYAANDIVLIVLWIYASKGDITYLSTCICFVAFIINDLYGFFNWLKMQKRQARD